MADDKPIDEVSPAQGSSSFVPVEPFDIIVFGGTGDLARRKLLPALYHRFCDGQIPSASRIIGVSRTSLDQEAYRAQAKTAYKEFTGKGDYNHSCWDGFQDLLDYHPIDVMADDGDWAGLAKKLEGAEDRVRVFYLAMPPAMFAAVCEGLKAAGLVTPHSRVVLEKPLRWKLMKGLVRFLMKTTFTALIIISEKRRCKICSCCALGMFYLNRFGIVRRLIMFKSPPLSQLV